MLARSYIFDEDFAPEGYYDFDNQKNQKCIRISKDIFDDKDKLKVMIPADWRSEFIKIVTIKPPSDDDDDIPF